MPSALSGLVATTPGETSLEATAASTMWSSRSARHDASAGFDGWPSWTRMPTTPTGRVISWQMIPRCCTSVSAVWTTDLRMEQRWTLPPRPPLSTDPPTRLTSTLCVKFSRTGQGSSVQTWWCGISALTPTGGTTGTSGSPRKHSWASRIWWKTLRKQSAMENSWLSWVGDPVPTLLRPSSRPSLPDWRNNWAGGRLALEQASDIDAEIFDLRVLAQAILQAKRECKRRSRVRRRERRRLTGQDAGRPWCGRTPHLLGRACISQVGCGAMILGLLIRGVLLVGTASATWSQMPMGSDI